jgi:CheY-specific phosphatase CheX
MLETIHQLEAYLSPAVISAFELMCFTAIEPSMDETECTADVVCGEIEFDGDAAGRLRLEMSMYAARSMASSFYGEEGCLSQAQAEAVIGEMTNVICGSMLSTCAPNGAFYLSVPKISAQADGRLPIRQCFCMDTGAVVVSLAIDKR